MLASAVVSVDAKQEVQTTLTLGDVPEEVYAGDTITFNGRLVRTDTGEGLAKAPITLKNENVFSGGNMIATGITDDNGRFSIKWIADSKEKDTFKVFANYMGSAEYSDSQSEKYTIEVERVDLILKTNKEEYRNGDQLIIFGSGRPYDVLSVFVTTTSSHTVLVTKITIDESGKFNATLLTWDTSYYVQPYLVHVRSITDMLSLDRVLIYHLTEIVQQPQGIETVLTLDIPSSNVTSNDDVVFTGKLETRTGLPIKEAIILIKHRDDAEGVTLAHGITSNDGRFFINWDALHSNSYKLLEVYGGFEGGNGFLPSFTDKHDITLEPRKLTLELNQVNFGPNDRLIVSGVAPKEKLNIKLIDPTGQVAITKNVLVYPEQSYEKPLMLWTRPSYLFPEGQYVVIVETENSPILTVSKTLYFEEPKPLSRYKMTGSVWYKDSHGSRHALEGAKVTISSPYAEMESYTDRFGHYAFENLHSIIENVGKSYSLTVTLDGKYFRLVDASNSKLVSKRIGHIKFDGSYRDVSLDPVVFYGKTEAAAARIFALQNDIGRFYRDVIGIQPKKIDIEIFSKETPKGKYGYESDREFPKIWIGKGTSSPRNPYTWDTLAHEYTHYMQDLYASVDHYHGMNHGGFSNPTTADSMVEGFADFMSAAISKHYNKEQAGKFLKYDLEHNFKVDSVRFLSEELATAGVFWDIYDEGMDDDDGISMGIEDIWNIMTSEYNFPSYHEDSGVEAMKRQVYYLKDLHYIITPAGYSKKVEVIEELFRSHGIIDGFTDPERPYRI